MTIPIFSMSVIYYLMIGLLVDDGVVSILTQKTKNLMKSAAGTERTAQLGLALRGKCVSSGLSYYTSKFNSQCY